MDENISERDIHNLQIKDLYQYKMRCGVCKHTSCVNGIHHNACQRCGQDGNISYTKVKK